LNSNNVEDERQSELLNTKIQMSLNGVERGTSHAPIQTKETYAGKIQLFYRDENWRSRKKMERTKKGLVGKPDEDTTP
jgi:hypothetical protein